MQNKWVENVHMSLIFLADVYGSVTNPEMILLIENKVTPDLCKSGNKTIWKSISPKSTLRLLIRKIKGEYIQIYTHITAQIYVHLCEMRLTCENWSRRQIKPKYGHKKTIKTTRVIHKNKQTNVVEKCFFSLTQTFIFDKMDSLLKMNHGQFTFIFQIFHELYLLCSVFNGFTLVSHYAHQMPNKTILSV